MTNNTIRAKFEEKNIYTTIIGLYVIKNERGYSGHSGNEDGFGGGYDDDVCVCVWGGGIGIIRTYTRMETTCVYLVK